MEPVQWVGVALVFAGIVWVFAHPTSTGEGGVEITGFSASGLTQGCVIAFLGVVLLLAPRIFGEENGTDDADDGDGTETPSECVVSGIVLDDDTKQPFPSVDVGLVPPGTPYSGEEEFDEQATTGPDGAFRFDCDGLAEGSTFALALSHAGWGGCVEVTEREVTGNSSDEGAIYVSNKVMQTLGDLWGVPKYDNCVAPGQG